MIYKLIERNEKNGSIQTRYLDNEEQVKGALKALVNESIGNTIRYGKDQYRWDSYVYTIVKEPEMEEKRAHLRKFLKSMVVNRYTPDNAVNELYELVSHKHGPCKLD